MDNFKALLEHYLLIEKHHVKPESLPFVQGKMSLLFEEVRKDLVNHESKNKPIIPRLNLPNPINKNEEKPVPTLKRKNRLPFTDLPLYPLQIKKPIAKPVNPVIRCKLPNMEWDDLKNFVEKSAHQFNHYDELDYKLFAQHCSTDPIHTPNEQHCSTDPIYTPNESSISDSASEESDVPSTMSEFLKL